VQTSCSSQTCRPFTPLYNTAFFLGYKQFRSTEGRTLRNDRTLLFGFTSSLFTNPPVLFHQTNPRAPDFKHKETKEALWIDSRSTPPSVLTRLAEENPSAGPDLDVTLEELWQNLYEDPGSWWDNRTNKVGFCI
jgi:hypothetical protein